VTTDNAAVNQTASPPSEVQAGRRARTHRALLDAAFRVFARHGYHGATLEEVAAEAGASKGAVYYHFDSKDDLFHALLEDRLASHSPELVSDARIEWPPDVGPEQWAARAVAALPLERDWNLLFWEFACLAARRPESRRRLADRLRAFRSGGAAQMRAMMNRNGIGDGVPEERLAQIVAALANGLAIDLMLHTGEQAQAETQETMALALALLWRGVAALADELTDKPEGER